MVSKGDDFGGEFVIGKGGEKLDLFKASGPKHRLQLRERIGEAAQEMSADFLPASSRKISRKTGDLRNPEMVIRTSEQIFQTKPVFDAEDERSFFGQFPAGFAKE